MHKSLFGTVAAAVLLSACGGAPTKLDATDASASEDSKEYTYRFQDPSLSPLERATDLVSHLTLEEKAQQMYDKAPAIERLGLHEYNWWNEALHGVARAGHATVFPQAIGMAATWDEELMLDVATIISDEGRAKHHFYASEDVYAMYGGLTFWSPNINIFRDPRWGRGQETYGEDPYLTGRMAVNFINGLQGNDEKYLKSVATVKHYAVHSGPEPTRHTDDYVASEADLRETYLPAFKMTFDETEVESVMCAYNAVWGEPACGSQRLMKDLLRDELGFTGYVVSDCGAIGDFYYDAEKQAAGTAPRIAHDFVETRAEAAALAAKMGTDLNCGDHMGNKFDALPEAVRLGLISEETIDESVIRLFTAQFKLGMHDDPAALPWKDLGVDIVASDKHIAKAEEAARASLVLLKNDGILPLKPDTKVAVIGPNATNWFTLVANYFGHPTQPVTALDGITAKIGADNVSYATGSTMTGDLFTDYSIMPSDVFFHIDEAGELTPGVKASYFKDPKLSGMPTLTQIEDNVDNFWLRSPGTNGLNDKFGGLWEGVIVPKGDGVYRLKSTTFQNAVSTLEVNGRVVGANDDIEMKAGESYAFSLKLHFDLTWPYDELHKFINLSWTNVARDLEAEALAAAQGADVVLFFGGIDANLEGEEMRVSFDGFNGGDRTHINLPASQTEILQKLHATGKPVVMINFSGSAMALNWENDNLPAIVQAFYPGEKTGTAIADLLWGDYSPSGRLPVTFYKSLEGMPAFDDYSMQNRTYKYFEGEPLFPFGHGLSYTSFDYGDLTVTNEYVPGEALNLSVSVTNTGAVASREVVQAYVVKENRANVSVPRKELAAFDTVHLKAGETKTVTLMVQPDAIGHFNEAGALTFPQMGSFEISVGGGQPGFAAPTTSTVVSYANP